MRSFAAKLVATVIIPVAAVAGENPDQSSVTISVAQPQSDSKSQNNLPLSISLRPVDTSGIPEDYASLRAVTRDLFLNAEPEPSLERSDAEEREEAPYLYYKIVQCGQKFDDRQVGSRTYRQANREWLARAATSVEGQLMQVYPEQVWKSTLAAWERDTLTKFEALPAGPSRSSLRNAQAYEERVTQIKDLAQLIAEIDLRRVIVRPDLPAADYGNECGGGESAFQLIPDPLGGRVWLTTQWSFDVCTARRVDPWDTAKCRWRELPAGRPMQLAGIYAYQAKWADGRSSKGTGLQLDEEPSTNPPRPIIVPIKPNSQR